MNTIGVVLGAAAKALRCLISLEAGKWWGWGALRKTCGSCILWRTSTDTLTDASVDISIVTRLTLDRHVTYMSIDCRPRVDRCFGSASTDFGRGIDCDHVGSIYRSTTGRISVNYRQSVGRVSFDSRARVYQYYLPIYRLILSVILDTIHRYIDRYLILSTDVSIIDQY